MRTFLNKRITTNWWDKASIASAQAGQKWPALEWSRQCIRNASRWLYPITIHCPLVMFSIGASFQCLFLQIEYLKSRPFWKEFPKESTWHCRRGWNKLQGILSWTDLLSHLMSFIWCYTPYGLEGWTICWQSMFIDYNLHLLSYNYRLGSLFRMATYLFV